MYLFGTREVVSQLGTLVLPETLSQFTITFTQCQGTQYLSVYVSLTHTAKIPFLNLYV